MKQAVASAAESVSAGGGSPAHGSELDLLRRSAAGDETAFAELMQTHLATVHAIAWRMLAGRSDVEDVVQDVFLALWRSPPSLGVGAAKLSTWLYRVAANRSIDQLRRRPHLALEAAEDKAHDAPSPEAHTSWTQAARTIETALQRLNPRQRLALVLTYYEELDNKQAAEIMEVSVEALESLLVRARRKLREDLEPERDELMEIVGVARRGSKR